MELNDVMRTTFSARDYTDDDVPDQVLYRILDNARFAPNGGNRQGWRVIVVRDLEVRRELVRLSEPSMRRYLAQMAAGENAWNTIDPTRIDVNALEDAPDPAAVLAPLTKAPVVLAVGVDLRVVASTDSELDRVGVISGASIYPFVHNILLQARQEGLGGVLTTFISPRESQAQELLGLPDYVAIAALLPIGRPVKQLTKLKRKPVEQFATLERADGEPLRA